MQTYFSSSITWARFESTSAIEIEAAKQSWWPPLLRLGWYR